MSIKEELKELVERYEADYLRMKEQYYDTYEPYLNGFISALDVVLGDLGLIMESEANREIKFRTWDYKDKRMDRVEITNLSNERKVILNTSKLKGVFGDVVLMKSTRLGDKNGVDIFEGDIIRGSYGSPIVSVIASVVLEDGYFSTVKTPNHLLDQCSLDLFISLMHEIEVIGNIHENPELMDGEE